jgi:hypothetical protein
MSLPALPSTTDIRSITERVNAIIKQIYNKVIPVGAANTVLTSDGTTVSWVAPAAGAITNTGATTFLGANVSLNNTASFFNGPNTGSIGASGQVWLLSATATLVDTGDAQFVIEIHDGTTGLINTTALVRGNANITASIAGLVVTLTAATTFTLRARDLTTVNGTLLTSGLAGTANKATSITAVRLS